MQERIDFKEICKEIICDEVYKKNIDELSKDELNILKIDIDTNYSNYRKRLNEMAKILGWDIEKYRDKKRRIMIPIEEKEFCKSAFKSRNSLIFKEIKKGKKVDDNLEIIKLELDRLFNVIENTFDKDKAKILKENLIYACKYNIIKKIYEIKKPLIDRIFSSMENIRDFGTLINDEDALYLIQVYENILEIIDKVWKEIVYIYCDIRNSEIDDYVIYEDGEYKIDENHLVSLPEDVVFKAINEYETKIKKQVFETELQKKEVELILNEIRNAR